MTNEIIGIVFDIARCSFHDGPGIRTTVFLKGCPLDCKWCHNPESKKLNPQEAIIPSIGLIKTIGKPMTVHEVMEVVIKDIDYYNESGGGLTISGGEPLLQSLFVSQLAKVAKTHGIHVALETSGAVKWDNFEMLLPFVDLFLFDYKHSDPAELNFYTKADYRQIESNFTKLYEKNVAITRRCLLIPSINDTELHIKNICNMSMMYTNNYNTEILLYHNLGSSKAKSIGVNYPLESLPNMDNPRDIIRIKDMFKKYSHKKITLKNQLL